MKKAILPVAVHVLLLKNKMVLLMRRKNTGLNDGKWSLPAGRLEIKETMAQGAVREAREEINVEINPVEFDATYVMHHHDERGERLYVFFLCKKWKGSPVNNEPKKCSEIAWFGLDNLPNTIIPHIKSAIYSILNGESFSEFEF